MPNPGTAGRKLRPARNGTTKIVIWSADSLYGESVAALLERTREFDVVRVAADSPNYRTPEVFSTVDGLLILGRGASSDTLDGLPAKGARDFAVVYVEGDRVLPTAEQSRVDRYLSGPVDGNRLVDELRNAVRPLEAGTSEVRERRRGYDEGHGLTRRETEIATLVAKGLSNRSIAERLGLREQSVKNYVSVVMGKMGLENRVQVALRLTSDLAAR